MLRTLCGGDGELAQASGRGGGFEDRDLVEFDALANRLKVVVHGVREAIVEEVDGEEGVPLLEHEDGIQAGLFEHAGHEEREVKARREALREDLAREADALAGFAEARGRLGVVDGAFEHGVVDAFRDEQRAGLVRALVAVEGAVAGAFGEQLGGALEQQRGFVGVGRRERGEQLGHEAGAEPLVVSAEVDGLRGLGEGRGVVREKERRLERADGPLRHRGEERMARAEGEGADFRGFAGGHLRDENRDGREELGI